MRFSDSMPQGVLTRRKVVRAARRVRRVAFELAGSARYSRPALHSMDEKLEKYLSKSGFFVEAGANDGFHESNTYYLERFRGWTGLLVEPIPELYEDCRKERRNSRVVNCALVSSEYEKDSVALVYGNLISQVRESLTENALDRLRWTASRIHVAPYEVSVPARTLSSLLDEIGVAKVDFMSLDVEGYEAEVLGGLDLARHAPEFLLVESLTAAAREKVVACLRANFELVEALSPVDDLYRRR